MISNAHKYDTKSSKLNSGNRKEMRTYICVENASILNVSCSTWWRLIVTTADGRDEQHYPEDAHDNWRVVVRLG